MPRVVLFNKPFGVLCQFSDQDGRPVLADFIDHPGVYPAGRLDHDSEGLLLLTGDGGLQARIADPHYKLPKTYWAQVDGAISDDAVARLAAGVELKDGPTLPADCRRLEPPPALWERVPPVRYRAAIPTSWIELTIREGRNRQVRRMTAAVGFPTLRLVRVAIGPWSLDGLAPGEWKQVEVNEGDLPPLPRHRPARPGTEGPGKAGRGAGTRDRRGGDAGHTGEARRPDPGQRPARPDRGGVSPSAPRPARRSPSPPPSAGPRPPTPSSRRGRGS